MDESVQLTKKERHDSKKQEKEQRRAAQAKTVRTKKIVVAVGLTAAVIGIIVLAAISSRSGGAVGGTYADPTAGQQDASVLVEIFEDFQCPACAAVHTIIDDLIDTYGDRVTFVHNDYPLPFHKHAQTAAVGGECVYRLDQDAFWTYADTVYSSQNAWSEFSTSDAQATFRQAAVDAGVNADDFETCVNSDEAAAAVQEDIDEGRSRSVNATPTVIVNGTPVDGSPYAKTLTDAIEAELAK